MQAWRFSPILLIRNATNLRTTRLRSRYTMFTRFSTRIPAYQHWVNDLLLDNHLFVFAFGLAWTWRTMNSAQLSFDWTKMILMGNQFLSWGSMKEKMYAHFTVVTVADIRGRAGGCTARIARYLWHTENNYRWPWDRNLSKIVVYLPSPLS